MDGVPYHVTQRGSRGQDVFFSDDDRRNYLSHLKDYAERYDLDILAYCLMTNHIHLVVIPHTTESLALTLRTVHMRHSQSINARFGWTGHLWQARYFSTAVDEAHLWTAVRYVERNPVRAGLAAHAEDYNWSTAAFHLGMKRDRLVRSDTQWGGAVDGWRAELAGFEDEDEVQLLRNRTKSGFPCGDEEFVQRLSEALGRPLVKRGRGRPRNG